MNARGQFWSLDIILAAAIFTLALGLVLSSVELSIFYGQQEKNSQQLLAATISTANLMASQSDLWMQYTPAQCDPLRGGDANACSHQTCQTSVCATDVLSLEGLLVNARCGPNFDFNYDYAPTVCNPICNPASFNLRTTIHGWISDNELSTLENCILDYRAPFRSIQTGSPAYYYLDMNAFLADGNYIHYYTAKPTGNPTFSISRRMLIFPFPKQPDANELRECLDGNCAQYLTDLNVRVWRT
jgi:hypothetical protein